MFARLTTAAARAHSSRTAAAAACVGGFASMRSLTAGRVCCGEPDVVAPAPTYLNALIKVCFPSLLFCYPPARNTRQHSPFSTTLHWIGHIPVLDGGSPCRLPDQSVHISTFLKMISERKKKKILKSRNNLVRLLVHVKSQTNDLLCVAACHLQRCCLMCSFAATLSELLGRKRVNIWTPHSSHGGKVEMFFFDNQVPPQA